MDRMDNSEDSLSFHTRPLCREPKLAPELNVDGISEPDEETTDREMGSSQGATFESLTIAWPRELWLV